MHNGLTPNNKNTEQNSAYSTETDFLVFTAGENILGLPYHLLIQILDNPVYRNIPSMPASLRGVIDFRGEAVPYYDARKQAGIQSLPEEIDDLVATLKQRKQDHLNWINKLKQAVFNNEEITVQTNPHKCAFGLWYDNFHSNSPTLRSYLVRFDKPHKTIHAIAIEADKLIKDNQKEKAITLIKETETRELSLLMQLFDILENKIRQFHYEYAIVLEKEGKKIALSVDAVDYFGKADEIIQPIPQTFSRNHNNFADALGRIRKNDETIEFLVINIDKFLMC